ncbi:Asp/Glu racemase [Oceanicoccus sagamiensis]|uniref:Asp/Glu racemase n=1 Tax=Oceanicoccus sagamiensis TaxID=716816 RepID=A0A1X9NJS7_9GAMM|nr:Asp/Glu racemase [Oceanicoccus sagamiensis]ARN75719.1 Asp/Glu racemase [Oceanicoccus sagamiensis]
MDNIQLAQRARIGVLIPATNTGVEYDLHNLTVPGVTWHPSRFWVSSPNWAADGDNTGDGVDNAFERFLEGIRPELPLAVRNGMAADIHHLMLGMSAETFWGGEAGNKAFEQRILDDIEKWKTIDPEGGMTYDRDIGLTTGANAIVDALHAFGAKKIGVIDPYPPIGDKNVELFFREMGFEVHKVQGLCRANAWEIARSPISEVLAAVQAVDADDVDVIVQAGTNLSTADIFPTLEHTLGKPCLSINLVTAWHALRAVGIKDRIVGKGRLLEEF